MIKTKLLKNLLEEVTKKYDYLLSEKEKILQETYKISITDGLTGLYNRHYAMERLNQELERSLREKTPITLIMFDLDNFKNINDKYGHFKGDEILKKVGKILKNSFRKYDIVSRMGGDEFLAIVFQDKSYIEDKLKEIRKQIESLFPQENLSVSFGVAIFPDDLGNLSSYNNDLELLKKKIIEIADNRMYQNKRERKKTR
jgi:diguanylate cyclase (GGDEF)-like protein